MISICIPVYNFNVTELVDELLRQSSMNSYPIEVLIFDDKSHSYFRKKNAELASRSHVSYLDFDYNIGRSKIRNRLADFASGEWLLFLDCDMMVDNPSFLKNYIDSFPKAQVICGGIKYGARPIRRNLLLRWKYGVHRECKAAIRRQASPHYSFMSGNFLISKDVYSTIRFNEEISGYGHEDTFFGIELKRCNVPVQHIDNQTLHIGLEPCKEYLTKSEHAVINLTKLLNSLPETRRELERSIKVLRVFRFLRIIGLIHPLRWIFRVVNPIIKHWLCRGRPWLFLFDIYKLALLARLYSKGWRATIAKYF